MCTEQQNILENSKNNNSTKKEKHYMARQQRFPITHACSLNFIRFFPLPRRFKSYVLTLCTKLIAERYTIPVATPRIMPISCRVVSLPS